VSGDIIARDITVDGRAAGQLVAVEIVHIRKHAVASGRVMATRFVLEDGAEFHGLVEPQHLEAALRVARFNQQKRDAAS